MILILLIVDFGFKTCNFYHHKKEGDC